MANASTSKDQMWQRVEIPYFEGVNARVESHIAKKYEFSHCENARSDKIGSVEKRRGTEVIGGNLTVEANLGLMYFENDDADSNGLFLAAEDAGTGRFYYYDTDTEQWTIKRTGLYYEDESGNPLPFDYTIAEEHMFVTNRRNEMFYLDKDLTVYTTASTPYYKNQVYVAPKAGKIAYYKDRLYVADYNYGSNRVPNGIGFSSYPLGKISIVTEDWDASAPNDVYVTDTTYIRGDGTDQLEIYRGGELKGSFEVTGKTEDKITVTILTPFDIYAADEVWIKGTYGDAAKVFRWPDTFGGKSPVEQKTYDTFKLAGEQNGRITMLEPVGDVLMFANRDNIGVWNDHYNKSLDLGIGCTSDFGYVKSMGILWFIDYNGIYATTGGLPQLKSQKVEPYIKGATRAGLESAAAGKKEFSVFFAIGDVTLYNDDGSVSQQLENVVLEYNQVQETWFVHTGINAKQFRTYKDSDNAELLAYSDGGNAGRDVYEFLKKDRFVDSNPAGDREIPFRVDLSNFTLGARFEDICYPKELTVEVTRGSALRTFVSLDNAPFYELSGDLAKGCYRVEIGERDRHIETIPRCRQVKFSIRDYTKKPCKISRLAIEYIETMESEDERASMGENINGSQD